MTNYSNQYDTAVEEGIKLFTRKGFTEVSIGDIVEASGLNRYAIYSAFGAKLDFFRACIERYCAQAIEELKQLAEDPALTAREAARINLLTAADAMLSQNAGCLVCESITEMKALAPDIADYCEQFYASNLELLTRLFERAKGAGELAPHLAPGNAASIFLIFKFGLSHEAKRAADLTDVSRKISGFVDLLFPRCAAG